MRWSGGRYGLSCEQLASNAAETRFIEPRAGWQVINLQKSVSSPSDEVRFTANIAVALDRLRGGIHDWAEAKRPSEARCHLRARIGLLLGSDDTWWSVTPSTNGAALGDAVCTALDTSALPWLDGHADDERLLELMRDPVALAQEPYDALHWLAALATQEHEHEVAAEICALQDRKLSRARAERQQPAGSGLPVWLTDGDR